MKFGVQVLSPKFVTVKKFVLCSQNLVIHESCCQTYKVYCLISKHYLELSYVIVFPTYRCSAKFSENNFKIYWF